MPRFGTIEGGIVATNTEGNLHLDKGNVAILPSSPIPINGNVSPRKAVIDDPFYNTPEEEEMAKSSQVIQYQIEITFQRALLRAVHKEMLFKHHTPTPSISPATVETDDEEEGLVFDFKFD